MRRRRSWPARLLGTLVVMLAAAGLAAPAPGKVTGLEEFARDLASDLLGRTVEFASLDIDFGKVTELRLKDVTLAAPEWAGDAPLAQVEELVVQVRPKTLVAGPVELPRVVLRHGSVSLVDGGEGEQSWALFGAEAKDEPETGGGSFPRVGELVVEDIAVRYEDRATGEVRNAQIDSARALSSGQEGTSLTLDGSLEGRPLHVELTGGELATLLQGGESWPVDLQLVFNDVTMTAQGTITEPAAFQGIEVAATLSGPNFANLYPLLTGVLPATPPFELEGQLNRQGASISLADFSGTMGDSAVDGTLTYDAAGARPALRGRVHSTRLDFDDLAPLIGAEPDPSETASAEQAEQAAEPGLLPQEPIPVERFRSADLDIMLDAEDVVDAPLPITRLKADFELNDGRLLVRPFDLGIAGGSASGEIAVNARERPPSADLDLAFQEISLKPFFRDSKFIDEMGGRFSGEIYLLGVGRSLDALLADASGDGVVRFRDGTVSGLLVEAAGVDVVESLALVIGDDVPLAVRCGAMALEAEHGLVRIPRAFVDTSDSLLLAAGEVDLDGLMLDLQIEARAKDFSLIDLSAPVRVRGPLSDPGFSIGDVDPLPFFEIGEQDNVDCQSGYRMIERIVEKPAQTGGG